MVHTNTYDVYSGDYKSLKMQQSNEAKTENMNQSLQQRRSLAASYSIALEVARGKKYFSGGEFIK